MRIIPIHDLLMALLGRYPTPYPVLFQCRHTISGNSAFGRNGVNANDIAQRWGIQKRIFAYASSYYRNFLQNKIDLRLCLSGMQLMESRMGTIMSISM
jgi:hypothetical protein